jgi:hypothetical protein
VGQNDDEEGEQGRGGNESREGVTRGRWAGKGGTRQQQGGGRDDDGGTGTMTKQQGCIR